MASLALTLDEPGKPDLTTYGVSDGIALFYRCFKPSGVLKGRIVFLHGIQSHGGWYPRSCAKIAEAGYEIYFLERRGCGQNPGRRGDFPSFRRAIDDVAEFLQRLPRNGPKVFLGGISWGGKLAAALPYRHPGLIDGLMLLCPGIVPKIFPPFLTRMRIALARVFRPNKLFAIPLNDPRLFTASPEWQRYVADDPLSLHHATARMLFNSYALDIYLRRAWKHVTVPVLLLLAEHDAIINSERVRAYVERFPTTDRRIILYPGAHHTLEFEAEGHPHVGDIISWLDEHR